MNTNDLLQHVSGMIAEAQDTGDLMKLYAVLQPLTAQVERAIEAEAQERGESFEFAGVKVSYRSGRATYDYQTAAMTHAKSNPALADILETAIEENQKATIDWRSVATAINAPVESFVKHGNPSVSIKVSQ